MQNLLGYSSEEMRGRMEASGYLIHNIIPTLSNLVGVLMCHIRWRMELRLASAEEAAALWQNCKSTQLLE
jgi:hypothetical protein